MKIAIIGAGHAGTTAALEATKSGAEVWLFSDEKVIPYYRPKITSVAFRQSEPEEISIHPVEWYNENKIKLFLNCRIERVDSKNCILSTSDGQTLHFDRIIITTGAGPIIPNLANQAIQNGYASSLWNLKDALFIRSKTQSIKDLAIIGGGVIGIESALRASDIGIKVTIIEKADRLMKRNLSAKASKILEQTLTGKGISILTSSTVKSIDQKNNKTFIKTENETLFFDHIILSIGCLVNTDFLKDSGIFLKNGVCVNSNLESNTKNIFSAGDSANLDTMASSFSVLRAINQSKIAVHNACNPDNPIKIQNPPATVDIKYNDFELHSIGYTCDICLKDEIVLEEKGNIYRSILKDKGEITSIQMIGSSKDLNLYRKQLRVT